MRILFVTNNYTPYSGGVVSSIQSTVQQLQNSGHQVRIVTLDFLGTAHKDPEYVLRIPSIARFKHKQNHFAIPWRMRSFLKKVCTEFKPDIVHVHHPFLLGPCAVRVARLYNIPVVFTYHTIYETYAHYVPLPPTLTQGIIKQRAIAFCNTVDAIIAPSTAIAQDIATAGVHTPITVIPSGLRPFFLSTPYTPKKTNGYFSLLTVGRFTPEKNIELALDLFAQLPHDGHYKLTLVGYGPLEQLLRAKVKTLGLSPELVTFVIKPTPEQLVQLYNHADLFLFTSTTDTQGLVLAESMSQGTPVVAIDGPGQQGIIKDGENGFIAHNLAELKTAVVQITQSPELHAQLQHGAWLTAREYDTKECVQKLLTVYNKLLVK